MTEDNPQKDIAHRELETLVRFCGLINSSLNIRDVLDTAMKWAEEFMQAEASTIYELDEDREELFVRLARGEKKEPVEGITLRVGEGVAGRVVRSGRPMVIQDVADSEWFEDKYDRLTGFKTRAMICVPLILRDRPIGVIQVLNKRTGEAFSPNDQELLTSMAQQIAIAMENARLYERLQRRFELAEKELQTAQEKLIRSERLAAVGHLVQGVAHEIRNPIMTIGGFAQRIQRELADEDRLKKYIGVILDEAARLEKLVLQVRDFAAVQTVTLRMDDMASVINEVLLRAEAMAGQQGVQIIRHIPDKLPSMEMDHAQLVTALWNVVENALDSMPGGGTLRLSLEETDTRLAFTVQDTGGGIPSEQLDSVYDPFVTSKAKGAGLGLTTVYRVVMNHHGEIDITSDPGKGTIVSIRLPLASQSS